MWRYQENYDLNQFPYTIAQENWSSFLKWLKNNNKGCISAAKPLIDKIKALCNCNFKSWRKQTAFISGLDALH